MVKLITEVNMENISPIVESTEDGKKEFWISGVFLQADVKNKNGRIYPRETMQTAVEHYTKEFIVSRRAMGELGHPESPQVNLDRVSHLVTELKQDGSNWIGKAKIINTPYGKIAQEFIKENIKYGVSSRGVGSIAVHNGINRVQNDYKIAAIDLVWDPSAPAALVNGIMESADWVWDQASEEYRLLEEIQRDIRKTPSSQMESAILNAFHKFMDSI